MGQPAVLYQIVFYLTTESVRNSASEMLITFNRKLHFSTALRIHCGACTHPERTALASPLPYPVNIATFTFSWSLIAVNGLACDQRLAFKLMAISTNLEDKFDKYLMNICYKEHCPSPDREM